VKIFAIDCKNLGFWKFNPKVCQNCCCLSWSVSCALLVSIHPTSDHDLKAKWKDVALRSLFSNQVLFIRRVFMFITDNSEILLVGFLTLRPPAAETKTVSLSVCYVGTQLPLTGTFPLRSSGPNLMTNACKVNRTKLLLGKLFSPREELDKFGWLTRCTCSTMLYRTPLFFNEWFSSNQHR